MSDVFNRQSGAKRRRAGPVRLLETRGLFRALYFVLILLKMFAKPLDNVATIWYNVATERKRGIKK